MTIGRTSHSQSIRSPMTETFRKPSPRVTQKRPSQPVVVTGTSATSGTKVNKRV